MSALLETPDTTASVRVASRSSRGQLTMDFDVESRHLGLVRGVVGQYLTWWEISDEAADRVIFAVNELLTNVLEHTEPGENGCRSASLLVQHVPGGITVVVRDQDPSPPVQRTGDSLDEESGRGLVLVRALVDELSVAMSDPGKDVWFFIADPVAPAARLP
ncbi:ATP-binding protein [Streptomyces sp. NPDC003247]|uniref:ATP-binding protein n=1 Tax=Streptomyces sp. NPDC003247 TaxID=3364677 RepID=UPI003689BCF8